MKIYRRINFMSLDIVAGALASSVLAARLLHAEPGWAWWLSLAFTVWILYMGDHVLDAWKHRKKSERELHHFIFRNRRVLLYAMGVIAIVDLLLIFNFLDRDFMKYALTLAGLVLLFYAMRHLFRKNRVFFIPGEVFVLVLYMAGTWLGPLVAREGEIGAPEALIALIYAAVLLMNLGVISLYDIQLDTRLGIASLAHYLGKRTTKNLLAITGIIVYLLSVMQFLVFGLDRYTNFALILSGMATILLLILYFPTYFRKNDYYRWTADAVLWMGFLSLLINS
jgi:1,4-dihydroxy-2-naphthoate octaprenyltransferase